MSWLLFNIPFGRTRRYNILPGLHTHISPERNVLILRKAHGVTFGPIIQSAPSFEHRTMIILAILAITFAQLNDALLSIAENAQRKLKIWTPRVFASN